VEFKLTHYPKKGRADAEKTQKQSDAGESESEKRMELPGFDSPDLKPPD
jgi:hypothetical protein